MRLVRESTILIRKTLERTINDIPRGFVDEIILVDDFSSDDTYDLAKKNISVVKNFGNKYHFLSFGKILGTDIVFI